MRSPKTHAASTASDDQVRALLERYRCPIPFHAVRTRFLGGIASPLPLDSPMRAVKALWGGELPALDSLDDVNELLAALVMGLWNRLSRHQERSAAFRLTRQSFPESREGLAALARLRREEIEGFVDGLFGDADQLDLPERAHKALGVLAELRALFEGAQVVAEDVNKPASPRDIATTLGHFREMTRVAEHKTHEAVISCARARRQPLQRRPVVRTSLH